MEAGIDFRSHLGLSDMRNEAGPLDADSDSDSPLTPDCQDEIKEVCPTALRRCRTPEPTLASEYQKDVAGQSALRLNSLWPRTDAIPALLETPSNFGQIVPGIYRSSFLQEEQFWSLDSYRFKTIVTLVDRQYDEVGKRFVEAGGIHHHRIPLLANKGDVANMRSEDILQVLKIVLNSENHPVLIHCNQGRHRTGCVVGCIRRILRWPLDVTVAEYRQYASPKAREIDERFIELFDEDSLVKVSRHAGFDVEDTLTLPPPAIPIKLGRRFASVSSRIHHIPVHV